MLLKGSLEEGVGFLFWGSVDVLREIGCILPHDCQTGCEC